MLTLVIRSVCVGIAAIVMAVAMLRPSPAGAPEVGWDLVVNLHDHPGLTIGIMLAALLVFMIGFVIGWRYFSRAEGSSGAER